ncbi:MAG: hypothetical protein ACREHD_17520, partial [Pirellulales bacterium]
MSRRLLTQTFERGALMATLAVLASATGCLQGEPEPTIIVETPVVDVGLVRGLQVNLRQPFTLRVWDRGPVKVTHVTAPCCGAGAVEPDLTSQELAAGSSHVVFVTMHRTSVGPWTVVANVFTDPPSPKPIAMTLSAVLSGLPVASPEPLLIDQAAGETARATLRISYMRTQDEEALELDRDACRFSPFQLTNVETRSELAPSAAGQPNPPRWDQLMLQLESQEAFPVGEHRFKLIPALSNGLTVDPVSATIRVRHPCRPVVERIFLGELLPGGTSQRTVPLVRSGETKAEVSSIVASNSFAEARINQGGDGLDVRVVAPETPGRVEGLLT